MIVTEYYATRPDGIVLVRTYSDADMMIEQVGTGKRYAEAIDPEEMHREYIETDEPIVEEGTEEDALNILLGRMP